MWKMIIISLSIKINMPFVKATVRRTLSPKWWTDSKEQCLKNQAAFVVFLDIKGAFDNLSSNVIAHAMTKHEVSDNIVGWMLGYLNYRFCKVNGSKQFFKLIRGTG
jgi:hypothetical protein